MICEHIHGAVSAFSLGNVDSGAAHWRIDPKPILLQMPKLPLMLTWYGLLFSMGLIISYVLFGKAMKEHPHLQQRDQLAIDPMNVWRDRLFTWIFIGIIAGARLGEVLFYENSYYAHHLLEIPKIWQGGLSSHGALLGILLSVWGFCGYSSSNSESTSPHLSFLSALDLISLVTCPCLVCIRMGNFINQEILGTVAYYPWTITLLSPKDGSMPLPRHPVQLYEAASYLMIGCALWFGRKALISRREGLASGTFLVIVLSARAILEQFKAPIGTITWPAILPTGQALSLPGIALGFALIVRSLRSYSVKRQLGQ